MKKVMKIAGMASLAFLLASCQDTENETVDQEREPVDESAQNETASEDNGTPDAEEDTSDSSTDDTEKGSSTGSDDGNTGDEEAGETGQNNDDTEEGSSNDSDDDNSDVYAGAQMSPTYFIDSHPYVTETDYLTAFSIERDETQNGSVEDRLVQSLIENDPSEQDILGSFTEMTVDGSELRVTFDDEGTQLSTTSAQTVLFYETLFGISDFYGIEEIIFLDPDGNEDVIVAQRSVKEPMSVKDERGLSGGYYTIYDKDLEQTVFVPGGQVDEQVENKDGEPLSFPETVEAMSTVNTEDGSHSSAMVEGLEVVHASLENGVATVQYTMDDEFATEPDRIVFENAMQFAALDFHAWEVRLLNDTLQESRTYPLIGQ